MVGRIASEFEVQGFERLRAAALSLADPIQARVIRAANPQRGYPSIKAEIQAIVTDVARGASGHARAETTEKPTSSAPDIGNTKFRVVVELDARSADASEIKLALSGATLQPNSDPRHARRILELLESVPRRGRRAEALRDLMDAQGWALAHSFFRSLINAAEYVDRSCLSFTVITMQASVRIASERLAAFSGMAELVTLLDANEDEQAFQLAHRHVEALAGRPLTSDEVLPALVALKERAQAAIFMGSVALQEHMPLFQCLFEFNLDHGRFISTFTLVSIMESSAGAMQELLATEPQVVTAQRSDPLTWVANYVEHYAAEARSEWKLLNDDVRELLSVLEPEHRARLHAVLDGERHVTALEIERHALRARDLMATVASKLEDVLAAVGLCSQALQDRRQTLADAQRILRSRTAFMDSIREVRAIASTAELRACDKALVKARDAHRSNQLYALIKMFQERRSIETGAAINRALRSIRGLDELATRALAAFVTHHSPPG